MPGSRRNSTNGLRAVQEEMNQRFTEVSAYLERLTATVEKFVATREGFLRLEERFIAHDQHDDERFEKIDQHLKDIKAAVTAGDKEESKVNLRVGKLEVTIALAMTVIGWLAAHYFGAH